MHLNCINETHTHRKLHFNKKLTFNSGSAIRCYECNSYNDTRCAHDIPPKDLSIECGDHQKGVKYSFCRKIKQVIEFSVNQCELWTIIYHFVSFVKFFNSYSTSGYTYHSWMRLGWFHLQEQVLSTVWIWWSPGSVRMWSRQLQWFDGIEEFNNRCDCFNDFFAFRYEELIKKI